MTRLAMARLSPVSHHIPMRGVSVWAPLPSPGGHVFLSDRTMRDEIERGRIRVEPLAEGCDSAVQHRLRLGNKMRVFRNNHISHIDLRQDTAALTEVIEVKPGPAVFLRPLEFALGVTLEHISCGRSGGPPGREKLAWASRTADPRDGRPGRSWLGRPSDAGVDEPGTVPDHAVCRMKIGQISFEQMTTPVDNPYGGGTLLQQVPG